MTSNDILNWKKLQEEKFNLTRKSKRWHLDVERYALLNGRVHFMACLTCKLATFYSLLYILQHSILYYTCYLVSVSFYRNKKFVVVTCQMLVLSKILLLYRVFFFFFCPDLSCPQIQVPREAAKLAEMSRQMLGAYDCYVMDHSMEVFLVSKVAIDNSS